MSAAPIKPLLARKSLLLSTLALVALSACQAHESGAASEAYVENGVAWAFGSVQLGQLDAPGIVMIKQNAPVQALATPAAAQPGAVPPPASAYSLYGAVNAATGANGERDIAYVDYLPNSTKLLAYSYQVMYELRPGTSNLIDVSAVLKKAGPSYDYSCLQANRFKVYLGSAVFTAGATFARVSLNDGLKLSLIADGVFAGQWALHYPDAPLIVTRPWQGMCPKDIGQLPGQAPGQLPGQMPGQNPNQNPGQFDACRALPAQQDLCNGDPTKDGCRPKPPVQSVLTPAQARPTQQVAGLDVLSEADRVYALPAGSADAKITFVSTTIKAVPGDDAQNAQLCAHKFFAVGRTVGRQVNASCLLKPAPATSIDGRLTCAVTVGFDQAQTYLEKVCDITGIFRDGATESQTVQVLKR